MRVLFFRGHPPQALGDGGDGGCGGVFGFGSMGVALGAVLGLGGACGLCFFFRSVVVWLLPRCPASPFTNLQFPFSIFSLNQKMHILGPGI